MLKRKATERLETWRKTSRKALLVTGARQIGKSCTIREFAHDRYDVVLEVNLLEDADAKRSLEAAPNTQEFLNVLALLSPDQLIPGRTLIFIDEIQESPDLVTMLKFLVDDGRYVYIFSGSMLGTEFRGIRSFPVGYVEELRMYPMDFEEFLWAVNFPTNLFSQVEERFAERKPVDGAVHDKLMRNLRTYIVVGGMPEVVDTFVAEAFNLSSVRAIQNDLNTQYRQDIGKYAASRVLPVKEIFDQLPVQLESASGRFSVSCLGGSARYQNLAEDFLWLVHAGVALKVDRVTEPRASLLRTDSPAFFKLYQSDTGMLMARYPQATSRAVYLATKTVNMGVPFENCVVQELICHGARPFYVDAKGIGEVDLVIEDADGRVVPIEVKSGSRFRQHAALDRLMKSRATKIREAVVLCASNVERNGHTTYLPLYMAGLLPQQGAPTTDFTMAPAL